jgi:hypothetical protein
MKRVLYSLFSFSLVGFLAAQVRMPNGAEMCKRVLLREGACGVEKVLTISPPTTGSTSWRSYSVDLGQVKADYVFPLKESRAAKFFRFGLSSDGKMVIAGILVDPRNIRKEETLEALLSQTELADIDGNGLVDKGDLEMFFLALAFGQNLVCPKNGIVKSHEYLYKADVNRDGVVDDADLLEILFNFSEKSEACVAKIIIRTLHTAR